MKLSSFLILVHLYENSFTITLIWKKIKVCIRAKSWILSDKATKGLLNFREKSPGLSPDFEKNSPEKLLIFYKKLLIFKN